MNKFGGFILSVYSITARDRDLEIETLVASSQVFLTQNFYHIYFRFFFFSFLEYIRKILKSLLLSNSHILGEPSVRDFNLYCISRETQIGILISTYNTNYSLKALFESVKTFIHKVLIL